MLSLYHYLYINIPRIKEFNLIIINNVNKKDFSINIYRFKITRNAIFMNFINK